MCNRRNKKKRYIFMDFKKEGEGKEKKRKSPFSDPLPLCSYMQTTQRSLQTLRSDGDKRRPLHMAGVSAITLRSGRRWHGARVSGRRVRSVVP